MKTDLFEPAFKEGYVYKDRYYVDLDSAKREYYYDILFQLLKSSSEYRRFVTGHIGASCESFISIFAFMLARKTPLDTLEKLIESLEDE